MGRYAVLWLLALAHYVSAQDASCDYSTEVLVNRTYYVYSPNYPNSYNAGSQCRWVATSPVGYNLRLDCTEINLPQSTNCRVDKLLVSKSGDPQLTGADTYCGRGTLTAVSVGRKMSIGLITTSSNGRFSCELRAQVDPTVSSCSCGYKKTNRIVGGQETGVNEYPMMAGMVDTRNSEIFCGAVIISSHYLVTAAHCANFTSVSNLAVVVGEHNVTYGDSPATQLLRVADVLVHPQYNSQNYDNDIAILLTRNDIVFSNLVGPACLPFKFGNNNFAGAKVTALGWGTQFSGGPISEVLMGVTLDVISQSSCASSVSSLTARQMCTFTRGKDACQDDSGGPLLYTDPATGLLHCIGLISFGDFCATDTPGVSTRLSEFLAWIVANTRDAEYCRK